MPSTKSSCLSGVPQPLKNGGLRPDGHSREEKHARKSGNKIRILAILAFPLFLIAGCQAPYIQQPTMNAIGVTVTGLWGAGGGLVLLATAATIFR